MSPGEGIVSSRTITERVERLRLKKERGLGVIMSHTTTSKVRREWIANPMNDGMAPPHVPSGSAQPSLLGGTMAMPDASPFSLLGLQRQIDSVTAIFATYALRLLQINAVQSFYQFATTGRLHPACKIHFRRRSSRCIEDLLLHSYRSMSTHQSFVAQVSHVGPGFLLLYTTGQRMSESVASP